MEEQFFIIFTVVTWLTAFGVYLYITMKECSIVVKLGILSVVFFPILILSLQRADISQQPSIASNSGLTDKRSIYLSNNRSYQTCEISIAWVYERPVDKNVMDNVNILAAKVDSTVCIYCGTTQCMKTFHGLKPNIIVKFAVISDLVQGTPLQEWLSRHPFNKVIAGRAFETHLQEVTTLGILWNFGGMYFNPTVRVSYGARFPSSANYSWVNKEERRQDNDLPSVFDSAYFPRNDPFVEELSKVYFQNYPKHSIANVPFGFNFSDAVWNPTKSKCKSTLSCPVVLENANLIHTPLSDLKMPQHFSLSPSRQSRDSVLQNLADLHYLPFVESPLAPSETSGGTTVIGLTTSNFPPPKSLNPIMLSVHVNQEEARVWGQSTKYLTERQPIGCRDSSTLDYFKAKGISAFLSGSMILSMSRPNNQIRTGIVATVSESTFKLLPEEVQKTAFHSADYERNVTVLESFELIQKYHSAELVISEDINYALLCAALETPVIFVTTDTSSITNFAPLFHTLDLNKQKATSWFGTFPWHEIPQNPNLAKLMRFKTTLWDTLRQEQAFHDAARRFGIIPMAPLISKYKEDLLFHLIFTTSKNSKIKIRSSHKVQSGGFNWRHMRTVESIFHHHPTAKVIVHSNTLSQDVFNVLTEVGYSITVEHYDLIDMLKGSPAEAFISKLPAAREGEHWYSHQSDLLRLLTLYKQGGVYMDTDMIVVRPLTSLPMNVMGYVKPQKINGAFLMYEKGNSFLGECLKEFAKTYRGDIWGWNGPLLITRMWKQWDNRTDRVLPHVVDREHFYLFSVTKQLINITFTVTSGEYYDKKMELLKTKAYCVHLFSKITGNFGINGNILKKGTIGSYLLNSYCVLCDRIY